MPKHFWPKLESGYQDNLSGNTANHSPTDVINKEMIRTPDVNGDYTRNHLMENYGTYQYPVNID